MVQEIVLSENQANSIDLSKIIPDSEMAIVVESVPKTSNPSGNSTISNNVSSDLLQFYETACGCPTFINRRTIAHCSVMKKASVSYATRTNNTISYSLWFTHDVADPNSLLTTSFVNFGTPAITYSVRVLDSWTYSKSHPSTSPIESSTLRIIRLKPPPSTNFEICSITRPVLGVEVSDFSVVIPPNGLDTDDPLYAGGPSIGNFSETFKLLTTNLLPDSWTHDINGWITSVSYETKITNYGAGYLSSTAYTTWNSSTMSYDTIYGSNFIGPNFVNNTQTIYGISARLLSHASIIPRGSFETTSSVGWGGEFFTRPTIYTL